MIKLLFSLLNYFKRFSYCVFLQVITFLMFFPSGLAVLDYLNAENNFSFAYILSFSFVISILIIYVLFRFTCFFTVRVAYLRVFTWGLLLANAVLAVHSWRFLSSVFSWPSSLLSVCFVGAFLLFANMIFALFKYPVDYGVDLFFYYTGCDTIINKKPMSLLSDMPDCKLYTDYTLPGYIVLLYNAAAGRNCRSITSFYLPATALTCVLVGEMISGFSPVPSVQISLAGTLAFALLPYNFECLVKASHTSGSGFGVMLLFAALSGFSQNPFLCAVLAAAVFLFLFLIRPEAKLFCMFSVAVFGFSWMINFLTGTEQGPGPYTVILGILSLAGIAFVMIFPKSVEYMYRKTAVATKTFSFHYWQYHKYNRNFVTLNQHWAFICIHYAMTNLGLKKDDEKYNMIEVIREIFKHPLSFTAFYIKQILYVFEGLFFIFTVQCVFSPARYPMRGLIGLVIYLFSLKIAASYSMTVFLIMLSGGGLIAFLPIPNMTAGSRHIVIFPLIFAMLSLGLAGEGVLSLPVIIMFFAVFLLFDLFIMAMDIFMAKQSSYFARCIDTLKKIIPPEATLACSFPHVFSYMLERKAFGTFYMLIALSGIAGKHRPDFILLNNLNLWLAYNNYVRRKLKIEGYQVVTEDADANYVLLKKIGD